MNVKDIFIFYINFIERFVLQSSIREFHKFDLQELYVFSEKELFQVSFTFFHGTFFHWRNSVNTRIKGNLNIAILADAWKQFPLIFTHSILYTKHFTNMNNFNIIPPLMSFALLWHSWYFLTFITLAIINTK